MSIKYLLIEFYSLFIYYIPNGIRELFLRISRKRIILMCSFLDFKFGQFRPGNWGDDLNLYFIGKTTKARLVVYQTSLYSRWTHQPNYMCIGSMIHDVTPETIVWGSGVIADDADHELKHHPKKVLAVRGKLTREYLLKRGIACPEIYGDPALLLPMFYPKNHSEKKYRLGVIPHIYDETNQYVTELKNNPDVLIISMKDYHDWHEIIDKICSCDMIISSSLHGVIVSDAYQVPNCWIEFSDKVIGNGFKFRDYYSAVGKNIQKPVKIKQSIILEEVMKYQKQWTAPCIDLEPLLQACPFQLEKKY